MAGYYSMMALSEDMIGLSMTNATPHVLPTFGAEPMMGTNPISLAVPANKECPFVLDMATSTVAVGKILIANRLGLPIPYGWAADLSGEITTDSNIARESKKLMPLGGTKELGGHKGYGLATMVDILCGVLSGSVISSNIVRNGPVGHFFGAFNIESFRDTQEFKNDMDYLLKSLKNTPPIENEDRVYYAGLIEEEVYQQRLITGIPLANKVVETLRNFAIELDISSTI
jgi:LDH2 family malate/lactate/ureidoglycolate dehydrogenase